MQQLLLIVQPHLTAYRLPVFAKVAECFGDVILASSPSSQESGYGQQTIHGTAIRRHVLLPEKQILGGRLHWQKGLIRLLLDTKPTKLLIAANPRALSFWAALFICRWLGISCYSYGQGFYDKPTPPLWLVKTYQLLVGYSTCYICYTASVADSLRRQGIRGKLAVAENSLHLTEPVLPSEKSGNELGLLFLGRLRKGCNLGLLIRCLELARELTELNLHLHVVGDGELGSELRAQHPSQAWITWHGEIYQQSEVRNVAQHCRVGCHPGDAGLSVVHFMGLSLVPVIHDRLDLHMGPEPSYVRDGVNGRCFTYADAERSLAQILAELFAGSNMPLAEGAFETYQALATPPLADRLLRVLSEN